MNYAQFLDSVIQIPLKDFEELLAYAGGLCDECTVGDCENCIITKYQKMLKEG